MSAAGQPRFRGRPAPPLEDDPEAFEDAEGPFTQSDVSALLSSDMLRLSGRLQPGREHQTTHYLT